MKSGSSENNRTSFLMKNTFGATLLFYFLIGFEFLYMATPFATFFYTVYRPGLEFLDKYPSISWVTGFFLPHLVEDTKSPFLNLIKPAGAVIALTGFFTFIICASQVYYAKIFKKGIVTGGLYKYIRHPQYTAFALCSFGLLILWPRYLVLIMFVTLLFLYYLLAKIEEKECINKFGESYKIYKNSTNMFLPIKISFLKIFNGNNFSFGGKILLAVGFYVGSIVLLIQIADLFKKNSIDMLYSYNIGNDLYILIFKSNKDKFKEIISLIDSENTINSMKQNQSNSKFINYILPADMYISEIPMIKPRNPKNHIFNSEYSFKEYKIIFTKAKPGKNSPLLDFRQILYNTLSLEPVAEIWIDLPGKKIIKRIKLEKNDMRYKNIPEPVF